MRIEQYAIDVAYIVLAACSVLAIADGDSDGDADSVGDEQSVRVLCTQLLSGMALVAAPPAAVLKWLRLAVKGNVAWRSTDPRLAALRHFLQAAGADAAAAACASGSTATATAAGRAQAARGGGGLLGWCGGSCDAARTDGGRRRAAVGDAARRGLCPDPGASMCMCRGCRLALALAALHPVAVVRCVSAA